MENDTPVGYLVIWSDPENYEVVGFYPTIEEARQHANVDPDEDGMHIGQFNRIYPLRWGDYWKPGQHGDDAIEVYSLN